MVSKSEFIKSVINDDDLFYQLMLKAEDIQIEKNKTQKPTDFGTGFIIGMWLGSYYEQERKDD